MTRLTVEQEQELSRLLRIDDTLNDVYTLIHDRVKPEEYSDEALGRILEVLGELREEAGEAFVRARREVGLPDPPVAASNTSDAPRLRLVRD